MDCKLVLTLTAVLSVATCQTQLFIPRKACSLPNQHCDCTTPREVTCLNINTIPNQLPNTTEYLDLESNFIGPVVRKDHVERLQDLPLKKLFLTNNNLEIIQDYAFELLYRLLDLDISENYIQALTDNTFKGLKRLTALYANDAGITTLSANVFAPVTTLRYIDLEDNRIATVGLEFAILPNLETLLLAENQITQIPPGAFAGLTSLTHLSLFGNRLNQPMYSWFRDVIENNGKIELDRRTNTTTADPNPWLCCSDLSQYHNYVRNMLDKTLLSYSQLDVVCSWPVAASGRLVSSLTSEELAAVPCSQYTTTTSAPLLNQNTKSSTPNSISKVILHHNFMSSLNDAGAFFILLLVAVLAGSLVGGLCYCYQTKRGKQRFHDFTNIFRPNPPKEQKTSSRATMSTELTTRPYRQQSPAYGATTSVKPQVPTMSGQSSALRPPRRAPPAPPRRNINLPASTKPIEVTNARYTMETDQSEDEIWSKTERKNPV